MPLKRTALKPGRKPGSQEPEKRTGPTAAQPGLESDEEQAEEPGRPYRDIVEAEARQYWQEISKVGGLVKPTTLEIYDVLPIQQDAKCRAEAENRYAEAETAAMQPWPETDATQAMETERPYSGFVESEARKYWQETSRTGSLIKPSGEEIRAAATPVLCLALRNRTGSRRHRAVAGMVHHAREKGWVTRFFSEAHDSPTYIDALIQLADDAIWVAREIPLPDHPPPRHPPIFYTIDSRYDPALPVPRRDAIIRGNYLYNEEGIRVTDENEIYPLAWLPGRDMGMTCTSLVVHFAKKKIASRHPPDEIKLISYGLTFEWANKPLNHRRVCVWFDWRVETGGATFYFSSRLRDYPYPSDLVFSPPRDSHK